MCTVDTDYNNTITHLVVYYDNNITIYTQAIARHIYKMLPYSLNPYMLLSLYYYIQPIAQNF